MTERDRRQLGLAWMASNSLLRKDFLWFLRRSFLTLTPGTPFLPNWHIELLGEYLDACRRKEIKRLLINVPPRSLKSMCVSVAWPAYLLGLDPATRVMAASYALSLSLKHSIDCRNVMLSPWYRSVFPGTILMRDQNEKRKFSTSKHGFRLATSVGGSATGEGGHFLIVDDPQNPLQVASASTRKLASEWFDHTFSSRLDHKRDGVIVVVMQRLHADDLSGHLLEKGGWEHLCLPAIAEQQMQHHFGKVAVQREAGDALHEAREPKALLEALRLELGSSVFEAQYQQNPAPADGVMIRREWLRRYAAFPDAWQRVVQSWDTAIKAAAHHDASVCVTMGEYEGVHYVMDVQVMRCEYPALKRAMLQLAEDWQPDAILVEDKASGQSVLQDLRRDANLPLIAQNPKGDKLSRMAAASGLIEAGKVLFPRDAAWMPALERELLAFPNAPHDDQVDALSQYLNWVRQRGSHAKPSFRKL